MTYYRGAKVSLRGGDTRLPATDLEAKSRSDSGARGRALFLKLFEGSEKPAPRGEQKVYAFYRRGVTPVEDTPVFSERKKAWVFQTPFLRSTKWALRLAGLGLLIAAVIWSKEKTTALLQDVAGLRLAKVSVEGNHYLMEDEIVKAAGLPEGENMFKLDLTQAAERVKKLDWVGRVFVERRLPSSILISVRERKPVALLDNGNLYGVDGEGRVLPSSAALLREDLPLVSGASLKTDAVGMITMAETLKPALDFFAFLKRKDEVMAQDVSEVNLSEPGSLKVTFIDGIQAAFNPPVTETDLRRMAQVLSDLNQKGKRAGVMDFRYRDMALVKTR